MPRYRQCISGSLCLALTLATLFTQSEIAFAQRFGGRGGFGRGGSLSLLRRDSVQTELKLTDSQKERIEALQEQLRDDRGDMRSFFEQMRDADESQRQALMEEMRARRDNLEKEALTALEPILAAEQMTRLRQILLQNTGTRGLLNDDVAKELGLSSEQKEKITTQVETYTEKLQELGRGASREERDALRQDSEEKILAELTEEQRAGWQRQLGAPFEDDGDDRGGRGRDGRDRGERRRDRNGSGTPDVARQRLRSDSDASRRPSDALPASVDAIVSFGTQETASDEPPATEPGTGSEKTLTFNFRYAPWPEVLKLFADAAGLTLDPSDTPPGTFSYYDTNRYTPVEALDVLNGYLLARGYILVRRDRFLVPVNIESGIPPNLIPNVSLHELPSRGQNELLSIVLPLNGLDATQAEKEIEPLLGPQGRVAPLSASNSVVVSDIGSNLMRVVRLLGSVTAPSGPNVQTFRAYPLTYVSAADAEQTVRKLFGLNRSVQNVSSGRSDRSEWLRSMFRRSRGDDSDDDRRSRTAASTQTAETTSMQVASDLRTNTLLVTASGATLRMVDDTIRTIDVPQDGSNGPVVTNDQPHLRVYRVNSADPREVTRTLNALMPDVVINEDGRSRRIHIFGTGEVHREVEQLIRQLDGGTGSESVAVIPLRRLDVYSTTATLRSLFSDRDGSQLTIEPDAVGRRLIVRGAADQLTQLKTVLAQLGEDGTGGAAGGSRQSGPIRSVPLGGRDPDEFMRLLEQIWSTSGQNPLRIVQPQETDRILQRPALDPDGVRSSSPSRDAASPTRTRSQREDRDKGDEGVPEVPLITVSQSTVMDRRTPETDPFDASIVAASTPKPRAAAAKERTVAADSSRQSADLLAAQAGPNEFAQAIGTTYEPADDDRRSDDEPRATEPDVDAEADEEADETETKTPPVRNAKPPVAVSVEGGNLVFSSQDADALDRMEDLIGSLTQALPAKTGWTVFYLRAADATEAAMMLAQLFPTARVTTDTSTSVAAAAGLLTGLRDSTDLSVPLRIIPDVRANALFVSGPPVKIRDVENMLEVLDRSELPDSLRDRVPRFIPVNYANVNQVAQIVRDVYKDYMGNDQNEEASRRRSNGFTSLNGRSRDSDNDRSARRAEILLTIGIDTRTSQLVVAASDALFREVEELVSSLDRAAFEAKQTVRVVHLGGTNPIAVQQALGSLIPQVKVSTTGSAPSPSGQTSNGAAPSSASSSQGERRDDEGSDQMRQYFEERFRDRMRERSRDRDRNDDRGSDNGSSDRDRRSRRGRGDR